MATVTSPPLTSAGSADRPAPRSPIGLDGSRATRSARVNPSRAPMSSDFTLQDAATQAVYQHNQQTYQHLKMAVGLNLRRQFFIAVCDNLNLRNHLAMQLQTELLEKSGNASDPPQFVSLLLDLKDPNPVGQIATWLQQHPQSLQSSTLLGFQILGIEGLTRQNPAVQRLFLSYLRTIERSLPRLNCTVLLWVTRPWGNTIQQTAPECWSWSTGIFEFAGDPVPLISSLFDPGLFPPAVPEPPQAPEVPPPIATVPVPPAEVPLSTVLDFERYTELKTILQEDLDTLEQTPVGEEDEIFTGFASVFPQELLSPDETVLKHSPGVASPGIALDEGLFDEDDDALPPIADSLVDPLSDPLSNPLLDPLPPHSLTLAELEAHIETLRSQEASLVQLALAHLNLGRYHRQHIEQGDVSPATLSAAIAAYEQVLEWLCFSELSPEEMGDVVWPDILNDLGTLYWLASRSPAAGMEPQNYLEQAVQAYQLGLKKIDEAQHTRSYAMLQNNLGTVLSDLAQWDNGLEYLEGAIVAYQAALKYRRPDTDPLKFAATQNNLGTAYWHLAQHKNMTENLKQAIHAYNQALRYYRPDREPSSYAMIQNNLGTAYWNLSQGPEAKAIGESNGHTCSRDWLLLAVNAYQSALRFRTIETATAAYAATQNNLGTAYWHLANLASDQPATVRSYLKLSIEAYQAALQGADKLQQQEQASSLSFDRYATHNNLGLILYQNAMLKTGQEDNFVPSENLLASALHHHLQALKGWQEYPDLYQTALTAVVQTIRTCYETWGTAGQNRALNQVPGNLLAEVLSKL